MDELPSVDAKAEPPLRPASETDDLDRLAVLEHQVRQLMSRLAAWVESQLVEAVDDRRRDLRALRSEVQAALNEQVAGVRAEGASVLTVAVRRLSVNHEELAERLDDIAGRSAEAVAGVAALSLATAADAGRLEAIEHQLNQRIARLTDSVQTQLTDSADRRRSQLEAMRAELEAVLGEQITGVGRQVEQTASQVAVLGAEAQAAGARTEAFEDRLRAAMTRLGESLEARLRDAAGARLAELDAQRVELVVGLDERVRTAAVGLQETVDARLAEAVSVGRAETEALRSELHGLLDDRLRPVADRAWEAAEGLTALSAAVQAETGRTEAFEGRVRAAISHLAESVESRLAEVGTARSGDVEALRTELQAALEERLVPVGAEASRARAGLIAVSSSMEAETARIEEFEERVRAVVSRLTESVEALATTSTTRPGELAAVRIELGAALDARAEALSRQAADGLAGISASVEVQASRFDVFEERVRTAVAALTESVDARLADAAAGRQDDLQVVRREATEAVASLAEALQGETARVEAFEHRVRAVVGRLTESVEAQAGGGWKEELDAFRIQLQDAQPEKFADRVGELVDARVAEVVERRRAELESLQADLKGALGQQLTEARTQIATAVAGANKRFVRAHEQLSERIDVMTQRMVSSSEKVDGLVAAAENDAQRLAALEQHARGDDDRLARLVEAKVAGMTAEALGAGVEALRTELAAATAAPLAAARSEAGSEVEAGQDRGPEIAALSAGLTQVRSELAIAAAQSRKATRAQDQLRKGIDDLGGRVEELAAAVAAAAKAEKGALAPLRSDVRRLQTQVSELAEAMADTGSRRRATAASPVRSTSGVRRPAAVRRAANKEVPAAKPAPRATKNGQ